MPTGTSIVVMMSPATMSCRSQDASYVRTVWTAGTQRIQPVWPVRDPGRATRPRSASVCRTSYVRSPPRLGVCPGNGPDPDVAPLDHQRLARGDPCLGVGVDLALAQAVDLQADEPARVRFVNGLIGDVLD